MFFDSLIIFIKLDIKSKIVVLVKLILRKITGRNQSW
jgi:hypothetical protein